MNRKEKAKDKKEKEEMFQRWSRKLKIDLNEPLSNYPKATFNTGDKTVHTFKPFE